MIKADEIAQPSSCLNRSRDDEPIFVLCARDAYAPGIVDLWASVCESHGVNTEKTSQARQLAQDMRDWQSAHGRKTPD